MARSRSSSSAARRARSSAASGALRYVVSPDHQHWHLLGFERYELRRADGRRRRARPQDRVLPRRSLRGRHARAAAAPPSRCTRRAAGSASRRCSGSARASPSATATTTPPTSRASTCRSTACADGRYVLVHEVNADRRLRESRYDNNAASRAPSPAPARRRAAVEDRCAVRPASERCAGAGGRGGRRLAATPSRRSPPGSRSRGRSRSCPAARAGDRAPGARPPAQRARGRLRPRAGRAGAGERARRGRAARPRGRPGVRPQPLRLPVLHDARRDAARAPALDRLAARRPGARSSTASAPGRSTTPAGSRSGPTGGCTSAPATRASRRSPRIPRR